MKNQSQEWNDQSYRYISSYLDNDGRECGLLDSFLDTFAKHLPEFQHSPKILDVGCGNGLFLKEMVRLFGATKGVGVEPSIEGVNLLSKKYSHEGRINFYASSAHSLPFESDTFDLVTAWSVFHWVGRNEYLQALGELLRVSSKFIMIMDFCPTQEYKTPYSHKEGFYTYKMDFEIPLLSSGILEKVAEERWIMNQNRIQHINQEDLLPFEEKRENWDARKMVLFRKNYDTLPSVDFNFF